MKRVTCGTGTNEPPLCDESDVEDEVYLLAWLRTFHNPVVAQVRKSDQEIVAQGLRYGGTAGGVHDPDADTSLQEDRWRLLSLEEWNGLVAVVDSVGLWSLPEGPFPGESLMTYDGSMWRLEGFRQGEFIEIECQGMGDPQTANATPTEAIGYALLEVTDMLPEDPQEVY